MTEQNTVSTFNHDAPSIFTVFGITGDLSKKKIIPSLWHLWREGLLPKQFAVIGFARSELSRADFEAVLRESAQKVGALTATEEEVARFLALFTYISGSFDQDAAFVPLAEHIKKIESAWGVCTNKLFYLAVPPTAYESIFQRLADVQLNLPCGGELGWTRILVEKPFGHDRASSREIQTLLARFFKEEQVYRIDHYLFKEIVQGIQNFRFSNNLFERAWDHSNIARIDIRLLESIGVENRGAFYDSVGTLQDVGQNHILAMLAAITMEYPPDLNPNSLRKNRTDILTTLTPWTEELVKTRTYRAQYEGYRTIEKVRPDSTTETYFALKTELLHPRWTGVPIYMESGKRMGAARKEIVVTFKDPAVCYNCDVDTHKANRIVFRLEPNDEIIVHFWTRKPGYVDELEERTMSFFLYEKKVKVQYVEEYAKVLYAAMAGNQAFFSAPEEIDALWTFTDPVTTGWAKGLVPLGSYVPDTVPEPPLLSDTSVIQQPTLIKGTIGLVGLGKMGAGLARQLALKGWKVVGNDGSADAVKALEQEGIAGEYSLPGLVRSLPQPRSIWLMVPHQVVDTVLTELAPLLSEGDTVIDGGNSPYKESMRRGRDLAAKGIHFLDVGVSGGPGGAKDGACCMVGGERSVYEKYEPLLRDISVAKGYAYIGCSGAGHFAKMVHNGIEYGMMQSIAEGFAIIKQSPFAIDVGQTAELYNHGTVIESRLIGWLASAYRQFGNELNNDEYCSPVVSHSGEGQWTVDEAHERGVPAPIIEGSLQFRKDSAQSPSYTGRIISALRNQFGGHKAPPKA